MSTFPCIEGLGFRIGQRIATEHYYMLTIQQTMMWYSYLHYETARLVLRSKCKQLKVSLCIVCDKDKHQSIKCHIHTSQYLLFNKLRFAVHVRKLRKQIQTYLQYLHMQVGGVMSAAFFQLLFTMFTYLLDTKVNQGHKNTLLYVNYFAFIHFGFP